MRRRFDVYSYTNSSGSKKYFSNGVRRFFGENKVVFIGDTQVFSLVMPLRGQSKLSLIGHILVGEEDD